jgi:predicted choloylglycine hydrolase
MKYYGDYGFDKYLKKGVDLSKETSSDNQDERWACSCFTATNEKGEHLFARNFDWMDDPALLLFTNPPRGYSSVSTVDTLYVGFSNWNTPFAASYKEKLGLLDTPTIPFDGMNEYGLAVGMNQIPDGDCNIDPSKVTIYSLEVMRLVLDHAKNVDEAVSLLGNYNVKFRQVNMHFIIADASGKSVIIEYVGGEMKVIKNEDAWQVSTNFTIYGTKPEDRGFLCNRYATAYDTLKSTNGVVKNDDSAMELLSNVKQYSTIWSVVYNMTTGDIQMARNGNYDQVYKYRLQMKQ